MEMTVPPVAICLWLRRESTRLRHSAVVAAFPKLVSVPPVPSPGTHARAEIGRQLAGLPATIICAARHAELGVACTAGVVVAAEGGAVGAWLFLHHLRDARGLIRGRAHARFTPPPSTPPPSRVYLRAQTVPRAEHAPGRSLCIYSLP